MATSYEASGELPHSESFLRSLLWQDVRMDLLFDVLAHPTGMPSMPEFIYMEQFTDEAEVRRQLSMLVEYGILERTTIDADGDAPGAFYALTPDGYACLDHFEEQFNDHIRGRLRDMFDSVSHPDHIEAYINATRPEPPAQPEGN